MGTTHNAGFTIIETMLFLAITGVLVASMLVGVGTAINIQRYHDSVTSFQSFLQGQYSSVTNVDNERDASWHCGATAATTQVGTSQNPGQSDCVILGRYITIVGGTTTVTDVDGYQTGTSAGNDITALKTGYSLGLSTVNTRTDSLAWSTVIAWPTSGTGFKNPTTPRSIAILIIRSPISGSTYTFTSDTVPPIANVDDTALKAMLVTGIGTAPYEGQGQRTICVDSQGLVFTGNVAVYIHAYANGATSIENRSNDIIASLGGDTKC
jgi:type II secretory pathway pseudopilin PulG